MEGQVPDVEQGVIITVLEQWKGALNRIVLSLLGEQGHYPTSRSMFLRRPRAQALSYIA